MKIAAIVKHKFTGEYWDFTITDDPITGSRTYNYFFVKNITGSVVPLASGVLSIFTDTQLRHNSQVRNLRDAGGNFVFPDFATGESNSAYVGIGEPLFDVFSNNAGWRYNLAPTGDS